MKHTVKWIGEKNKTKINLWQIPNAYGLYLQHDYRLFLHLLGRMQSFVLGFGLSRQTGNGLDEFGNGCIGFGIVVSSSVNRKFGTSSGFGEDLTGQGLRRATKTAEGVFGLVIIQINKSIVVLLFLGSPGARVSV